MNEPTTTPPPVDAARRDRYATPLFAIMRQNGWDGERSEQVVREMDLVLDAVIAVADAEQAELHTENAQLHRYHAEDRDQLTEMRATITRLRSELDSARRTLGKP